MHQVMGWRKEQYRTSIEEGTVPSKTRNIDILLDTSVVHLPDYIAFYDRNIAYGIINGSQIMVKFRFITPQLGANGTQKQWQKKHFC